MPSSGEQPDGVFTALEKQYLKSMTFCIFTQRDKTKARRLVESYRYEVDYPEAGKVAARRAEIEAKVRKQRQRWRVCPVYLPLHPPTKLRHFIHFCAVHWWLRWVDVCGRERCKSSWPASLAAPQARRLLMTASSLVASVLKR